ncbi:hypothetical protein GALMADRAFT_132587 [Galerina marginata CBS 339.88]|uniref:Uncharacterized protein n=1 Tax=Galerina marginata (strain CBS 339.88) TaxID=685588 RepID=A0A067TS47_GALM3|nr:hypothetical protein GALMADRAFT_132587 [Galerina marginata CBS 339.88]
MTTPQAHPSFTANPQQIQKYDNYPGYPANTSGYANQAIRLAIGRLDSNAAVQLESVHLNWLLLASKGPMYALVSNQRYAVETVLQHVNPLNNDFFSRFEVAMGNVLDMMLPRPLATPSPQPDLPGPSGFLPYINPNASGSSRQASRYFKSKSI